MQQLSKLMPEEALGALQALEGLPKSILSRVTDHINAGNASIASELHIGDGERLYARVTNRVPQQNGHLFKYESTCSFSTV